VTNFPGNPYAEELERRLDLERNDSGPEEMQDLTAEQLIALTTAFELRTANLLKAYEGLGRELSVDLSNSYARELVRKTGGAAEKRLGLA
jgi:hypothetical protein